MKKYLHIFAVVTLLFTGCYDELSEQTQSHIDALKQEDIASIQQQVQNITASIGTIESLSTELVKYIDILQQASDGLETDYDALAKALEAVKAGLQSEIDDASAEMLTAYETAKTELETKIKEINAVIAVLQAKQADLDSRADALRKSLDEDYATTDWVKATFATLESQQKVANEVAEIKAHVDELTKSLDATEKQITELLDETMGQLDASMKKSLKDMVESLTKDYEEAIANAKKTLQDGFDEALNTAISDLENSLKDWVSKKLDGDAADRENYPGYLKTADALGYIAAFNTLVGVEGKPKDQSIQDEIDALQTALQKAQEDLTTAYKEAIEAAINKSSEEMGKKIADEIGKVQADIDKLVGRVETLEGEVVKLRTKVTELQGRINTVDEQIAAINTSLHVLDSLKMNLQQYIESVESALLKNDDVKYDESKALIDALQKAADSIQSKIDSLSDYVGTLPEGVKDDVITWAQKTLDTVDKQFDLYMNTTDIETYKAGIDQIIAANKITIAADSTALSTLIDDAKDTIDGWINDELKSYHTAAVVGTKIDSLRTALKGLFDADTTKLHKSLDSLNRAYEKAVSDFESEYKNAISDAITKNQGKVDSTFNVALASAMEAINGLKTRESEIDADVEQLKSDIEKIRLDIIDIRAGIGDLETFIKDSGFESLQAFVDTVNARLKDYPEKFATDTQVYDLKKIVRGDDTTGTTSGLKFWVDQMNGLTERLGSAETDAASLAAFFDGFGSTDTLDGQINALRALLKELKEEVDGDGTDNKPGLQSMIDSIMTALYGSGKDKDNPSGDSILGRLKTLTDNTLATMFHSISYVPTSSDASVKAGNGVSLEFIVDPAPLVEFLVKAGLSSENVSISLTSGTITGISGSNGVLTVTADLSAGWTALCVEIANTVEDKDNEGKPTDKKLEFISQYILVK